MDPRSSAATSAYPNDIDALPGLDQEALLDRYGIVVDWRAEEDELVAEVGGHLAPGDTLVVSSTPESEVFDVQYNGVEHRIPLTFSPVDRYVAIGSLISILGVRYELRRLKSSMLDDTHVFLLLLHEDWRRIDERHRALAALFEPVPLGVDGFSGNPAPYLKLEGRAATRRPWWRFW